MKQYIATYWRENPQLQNGGYLTTRTIEAKTIASANKKAKVISDNCGYGGMQLLAVELKEDRT